MSKKMLKRSLALGALMAFVITGQALAAGFTFNNVTGSDSLIVSAENSNYKVAFSGNNNVDGDVSIDAGMYANDTASRLFGIGLFNSGDFSITGKTIVNANGNGKEVRAVRIFEKGVSKRSAITFNDLEVSAESSNKVVYGFDNRYNSDVTVKGNAKITAEQTSVSGEYAIALTTAGGATTTFNGDTTEIVAKSKNGAEGVEVGKTNEIHGSEIVFNSAIKTDIKAESNYSAIGIHTNCDKVTFNRGVVSVTATNTATTKAIDACGVIGNIDVKSGVSDFSVTVTGSGRDNGDYLSGGDGTSALNAQGHEMNIAAQNLNITVNASESTGIANRSDTHGIIAIEDGSVNVTSKNITITVNDSVGDAYGVLAGWNVGAGDGKKGNGNITLGGDDSVVTVKVTANDATGIMARGQNGSSTEGSTLTVNGKLLDIDVDSTGGKCAAGIFVSNGTESVEGNGGLTKIVVNSETTTIDAVGNSAEGIATMSEGSLFVNSNITVNADTNAIFTRGNAKTYINFDEAGNTIAGRTTVLNGDIAFGYDEDTSGTPIDAELKVNLEGDGSSWTGDTTMYNGNTQINNIEMKEDGSVVGDNNTNDFTVSKFTLNVSDGAKWTTDSNSFVNKLTVGGSDASLNLVGDSAHTVLIGDATFKDGSKLYIKNGENYLKDTDNYALEVGKLTVENGAKIEIGGIAEGKTYNVAKGENATKEVGEKWTIDNNLLTGTWNVDTEVDGLQVTTVAKKADEIAKDMGVDSGTASALGSIIEAANNSNVSKESEAAQNVVKFAQEIASASPEVAAAAAEAVIKMAEAGGNSATAANIVKNVTGVTNDRLSFNCGHSAPHKGGHGVGLFEEGSGADIWAEYVHGKDKVEDMPSSAGATSYEGQYNGFVMGVDFKKVNKFQSGIAFNYGEGDTNTVGSAVRTRSDYDFWGIGYYGNIHNDDSNVIFDINYAKTDSDVTNKNISGLNYEASPETTTWTAGVKVEKLYQNENVQIVPYTGLRYMSIDPDDYATKCGTYKYSMDRQDIWLLPVGVSIRQEIANDNGWTVSPRVDLSYIWAFGDTDSNMEFATALNTKTNIGYDVMDDGSFLGLVGIEAHKGQWGYGVAYSYQKGDHSESKKWYVDVNYSF